MTRHDLIMMLAGAGALMFTVAALAGSAFAWAVWRFTPRTRGFWDRD